MVLSSVSVFGLSDTFRGEFHNILSLPFIIIYYDLQLRSLCATGVTWLISTFHCIEWYEGLTTGYAIVIRGNVALVWCKHRIRI